MTRIRQGKLRLLQGVSAVLAISTGISGAHAQTVEIGNTADVANINGVLASNQENTNNVTANALTTTAETPLGDVTDGSVPTGGGTTGSVALGNLDTISYSDTGAAQTTTSTAMIANQLNDAVGIDANTTNTLVSTTAADVSGGSVTLLGSTDTSSATGNSANQTLTLGAAGLTLGTTNATAESIDALGVGGEAVVVSKQRNEGSDTTASTTGSTIELQAVSLTDSTLKLGDNTQTSTATGSTATNGITVSGTDLGTGVAVASQQYNDATSTVAADTAGSANISIDGGIDSSSLSLSGNKLLSQSTGVTTANTLNANGTNVTLEGANTVAGAVADAGEGTVEAGYAILNDQAIDGTTSASTTTEAGAPAFKVFVSGDGYVQDSTLANDGNTASAKAQGAVTTNAATLAVTGTLDAGTASVGGIANAVSVANVQNQGDLADVTAEVTTAGGTQNVVSNYIDNYVDNSSLSASSNKITATAEGANATNTLVASATNLSVAGSATGLPSVGSDVDGIGTANAAFSLLNAQSAGTNAVSATVGDRATVNTSIYGDITDSTVFSNGNTFSALATSNKAVNGLSLSGTVVEGSVGLLNTQNSSASVTSDVGVADDAGATIYADYDIRNSSVAVNGNIAQGSAVANSSNNQLAVTATTLDGDGTGVEAWAESAPASGDPATLSVEADYSLGNLQTADGSSNTEVYTTFGISQYEKETTSDSKLSVSNNNQFAEALANTSTNKLTLNATDAGAGIAPTAALGSMQEGAAVNIDSTSDMNVYASAASIDSAIVISGNANTALAVVNNAGNALNVTGTNLTTGNNGSAYAGALDGAEGDFALNSWQEASGTLDSTATTNLYNYDRGVSGNTGTDGSTVSFASNATTAEASANRVANALTITGSADTSSTAALNNTQQSSTTVNATADSDIEYTMTADSTWYAANGSAISIDGNATTALARGNTANNAMTYAAGPNYSGQNFTYNDGVTSVEATAAVLNYQSNSGGVTATANGATYAAALDADTGAGAALNSAVSVTNNTTAAAAYGNSAVNTLAMYTVGSGIPSGALSNIQYNNGAVTATATAVTYSAGMTGGIDGSAIRNTGNVVTAQAVGNSSVSSITGGN